MCAASPLQRIVKKIRRHPFVFATNRDLPATNNGSERALRPCAMFRKITNGFRTEWGAKLYAAIRSIIETAAAAPSAHSKPFASHWPVSALKPCLNRTLRPGG
jgi:hypothetical protein